MPGLPPPGRSGSAWHNVHPRIDAPFMHICVITNHFPTRSETFVVEHVLGLSRRGYQVSVISGGPGEGIAEAEIAEIEALGVRLRTVVTIRSNIFRRIIQLLGVLLRRPSMIRWLRWRRPWHDCDSFLAALNLFAIQRLRPDLLHIHFGTNARALYRAGARMPAVVTWHGYDANTMPRIQGEDMYHSLFGHSWRHSVGSPFMRQRLLKLGAKEDLLSIIPMGIDLSRFEYTKKHVKSGEPLRLISVGRLDEMKGHEYLIQAVAELINEAFHLSLRIVGAGDLHDKLKSQIADLGMTGSIELTGPLPHDAVAMEMRTAHVFILTGVVARSGRVETQGVVFAEAQAAGLPVIGSSIGGIPGSFVDGVSGLLCPPKDILAIKNAVRFFYDNPQRIHEFGKMGRMFVEEHFTSATMTDRFEDLYRQGAGGARSAQDRHDQQTTSD